ncbi:ParA family protein [Cupriavidus basilensis]|jgi:chromosome partitioning protein|uniref:ParA family protein n=1 Tax=Cupriavidus basilensis TaxID=68895 RepID=UPI0023E88CFB|nr:ParA family protein [Cupriavidus basilensis]MDF3889007.1 ParA family protein [Cupriavidus basilensis]
MKTIAVVNQKGGQGKSILVCQLAFFLALAKNKRVAVIDADEQGSISTTLRKYVAEGNYAHTFFGAKPIEVQGDGMLVPFVSNDVEMRKVEKMDDELQLDANKRLLLPPIVQNLKNRLADISGAFDWCLIDTPGSNSKVPNAALIAADFVLVPSVIDPYSLPVVVKVLQRVWNVKKHLNPKLELIGVLPNQFKASDKEMGKHLSQLLAMYKDHVLPTAISNRASMPLAADNGIPIWKVPQTAAREATKEVRAAFELIGTKVGGF